mmetsp:Transcript_21623/g.47013  ORF Transcript_21623/g.47013 Transcript_21623/m.47013 type:complete len:593 (-) Transcript_21623:183-1961(-)
MISNNESALARINRNDPTLTELTLEFPFGGVEELGSGAPPLCQCFPSNAGEWEALGRGIGRNTHLKVVDIDLTAWIGDENMHASLIESFCQGLSHNRSLQRFALKFCDFDLFEKGILQQLTPFLERNRHLRVLDFCYSPIEYRGTQLLSSTLDRRKNKSLEKIVLSGTAMEADDEGEPASAILTALKKYNVLKTLEFEMNDIGYAGCTTLSSLLQSPTSTLQNLNLRDSCIDNDRLATLMASLAENTALEVLNLSNNQSITHISGWAPLLSLLQSPTCNLKSLSLGDNALSYDVAVALVASLTNNRTLTCLALGGNPSITSQGFVAVTSLLRTPSSSLELVDLSENELDDDVAVAVANSMANNCTLMALRLDDNPDITTTGSIALSAILRNPGSKLRLLDLKENKIDDDSAIAYATSLANNRELKALCLGRPPPIKAPGWAAFARLLCDTSSINNTYLSNHTLNSFGYSIDQVPDTGKVGAYLKLNQSDRQCRARKILVTHFRGRFSMEPFTNMKIELLVHVLAWFDKIGSGGRDTSAGYCLICQSAMFHFLRSEQSLFERWCGISALEDAVAHRFMRDDAYARVSKKMRFI